MPGHHRPGRRRDRIGQHGRARRAAAHGARRDLQNHDFDYVFIDCPPSLGLLTINALVAAPEVLIPIQCEYYALEGVGQLLRNIEMVKAHLNPHLNVSTVILTMYDGRTRLADQVAEDVRAHFGDKVLRTVIPRSVKVSEAPGYGMTILDYDPGSRGAMSYMDASRELAARGADAERTTPMTQPPRKRSGLGRGLASLIPTGPADTESASMGHRMGDAAADVVLGGAPEQSAVGAVYREIDPSAIERNPRQPRQVFDEEALAELVHSIREFGLMQPIVVRARVRRSRGAGTSSSWGSAAGGQPRQAGLATIPAIVRETADDSMLRDALLENIHRVQLNPLEEAAAYQQLLDEFEVTHDELAARIGRSRPLITNMIRLLRLPIAVQRRVAAGVLSAGHARALLALEGGPELARGTRRPHRRRGPVGARDRGGGDASEPRATPRPRRAAPQAHPHARSARCC